MRPLRALLLLLLTGVGDAQDAMPPGPREAAYRSHVLKVLEGVRYRQGIQELPGGIARLELPEGYRYLDPEDARKVVVDLWGNPPAAVSDLLGMVIPAGEHLASPDSWTIVVSFREEGHVSDADADGLDEKLLFAQLAEAARRSNLEREAAGFQTMELVGWAVPPRYHEDRKVLLWAKRFDLAADGEDTLNYEVRALGRRGVLCLNGIAGMARIADIEAASPAVVSMLRFNDGHRYDDFDPAVDRKAALSLAGLLVGATPDPQSATARGASDRLPLLVLAAAGTGILLWRILGRRKRRG